MSAGMFSDAQAVTEYRRNFARRWARVLHQHFHGPAQVARAFGVDDSTAENWWAGANAPQGWVIGRAMVDPALREAALKELTEH